jgi:hypothetical protein
MHYDTARDLFDLYRAVYSAQFVSNLARVDHLAMLFHNDCMYIAHHLLTLGHQYRSRLPPPLNKTSTFVDLVPAFRKVLSPLSLSLYLSLYLYLSLSFTFLFALTQLTLWHWCLAFRKIAEDVYVDQLQRQREALEEMVSPLLLDRSSGGAQGDSKNRQGGSSSLLEGLAAGAAAGEDKFGAAERCVRKVLHHLNHLCHVWQGILAPAVYHRALGSLFDSVLRYLVLSLSRARSFSFLLSVCLTQLTLRCSTSLFQALSLARKGCWLSMTCNPERMQAS